MPLAFCILAHKNPEQLRGLAQALAVERSTIVIHYDKRAPSVERDAVEKLVEENSRVTLIKSRKVNWGRWSQMQAQLDMMEKALEVDSSWTHLLTISGQDFPLQTVEQMERILNEEPKQSMIEWFDPFEAGRWKDARERITRWHFDSDALHRFLRLPGIGRRVASFLGWQNRIPFLPGVRRQPPTSFRWYGGSNHHNLSRKAVEYVVRDPRARLIGRRLRRAGFPEESYIQSALLNSPLANTLVNTDRRAIFWEQPDSPSPKILTMGDLTDLQAARQQGKFFARKFDTDVDAAVVAQLATIVA
ncbi:MAG: hypothetical protein GVY36_06060 [Verrucomicrobia bacterium]|jgi:hypothetical protein|nr:hypothetical protein [Verrucomicrobiota bacterium]